MPGPAATLLTLASTFAIACTLAPTLVCGAQAPSTDRQVDLVLDKPTVVTNEMHLMPPGKTDLATARAMAPTAPQIIVTVSRI